ncbi:aldehyde dehydrogenase family protein [Streptomyces mirabilis]|uniref:aldehyde dehydrogenase family protein n=1 Tax=Streptomyces mirabilis TaxID=68239 RepID=UPI003644A366
MPPFTRLQRACQSLVARYPAPPPAPSSTPLGVALVISAWNYPINRARRGRAGDGTVGRIVMTAVAKSITPVGLELSGTSPVFVDRDADIATVAQRLAVTKFGNAGRCRWCSPRLSSPVPPIR